MNNDDIKTVNVLYGASNESATSRGTAVYISIVFTEDGAKKLEEMTEKEKIEYEIGKWWHNKPLERKILEKYRYITNLEFDNLSNEEKRVIIDYYNSGIKDVNNIIERMKINYKINSKKEENDLEDR